MLYDSYGLFMVPPIGKYIIWVEMLGLMFTKTMVKTAKRGWTDAGRS